MDAINVSDKEQFFKELFHTAPLTSLRENQRPVKIRLHITPTQVRDITWDGAYPFLTIEDVKAFIYTYMYQKERSESSKWYPKFVFLGIEEDSFVAADYIYFDLDTRTRLPLKEPYTAVRDMVLDDRFVDNMGNMKPVEISRRGRSTLEDLFHGEEPVFHAYTLQSLLTNFRGQRPISGMDWNSYFAPYFPDIPAEGPYILSGDDENHAKLVIQYTLKRDKLLHQLDELLESTALTKLSIFGIRNIKLVWTHANTVPPLSIEEVFYSTLVNGRRPFMRLIPTDSGAVSKIHTMGTIPIPDVADPSLLVQWSRETSPIPKKDVLIIKSLLRGQVGSVPAIYGTFHIFEDGSIDYTLYPPKIMKKLDINADMRNIAPVISQTLEGIDLDSYRMQLSELSVILSLRLDKAAAQLKKAQLQKRLRSLQPFFYEIAPLPDESPIIMLRYKAVSEFAKEDNVVREYITQYMTRRAVQQSDNFLQDLMNRIIEEFGLQPAEARSIINDWLLQNDSFTVTSPETGEFLKKYNPGIDIAIFGAHPFYTIHCYRINSKESLARIYTLLSVLLSADDETLDYFVKQGVAAGLDEITDEVQEEIIEREEVPAIPVISNTEQPVDLTFLADFMGEELPAEPLTAVEEKPAPTGVPAPDKAVVEAAKKGLPPPPDAPILAKGWFINKLKEIDPRLFSFKTSIKGDNGYTRQCAANDDRQPFVLTHEQYMHMREVYAEDEDIFFVEYPFEGRETEPPAKSEVYRILKFGSDPAKLSYYLCAPIFCLRDQILIRPGDLKSRQDREGNPKEKNTCPFCGGTVISDEDRNKKSKTATVIVRKYKPKSDLRHSEVGFLKSVSHPEGFSLPCCFTKPKTLRIKDPQFKFFRDYAATEQIAPDDDIIEEDVHTIKAVEYGVQLARIHKEYILGAEKHPIESGKFGVLTAGLDTYFSQDSKKIVSRTGIRQELIPSAEGFLRMGVEYTTITDEMINPAERSQVFNEGLLGALVPLLMKNTIDEVRGLLIKEFNPRVFVAANYGNLVNEFYNSNDALPTQNELKLWASRELGVSLLDRNMYELGRIYIAYNRFIGFLKDTNKRKELRHISAVLAQPGIITSRGLVLIVLDHNIKDPDDALKSPIVRCPPYGISPLLYDTADVAFVIRDNQGIYTPIVYSYNSPAAGKYLEEHRSTLRFQAETRAAWPKIVQKRAEEFFNMCAAPTVTTYTSYSHISTRGLAPLSQVISSLKAEKAPVGILRDSYNHIAGITYRALSGKGLVIFPVLDDGTMPIQIRIHLDWDDVAVATIDDILETYTTLFLSKFAYYKGYKPLNIVQKGDEYIGIQLENGIIIPGQPVTDLPSRASGLKVHTIDDFEWSINKRILDGDSREFQNIPTIASTINQIDELYEHFRVTVANWLSEEDGAERRKRIEEVIFRSDLMGYEKRKRLQIIIGGAIRQWFYEDDEAFTLPPIFLRSDCRRISKDKCTGACKWVSDEGQCKIHIPRTADITGEIISTADLFVGRIIEELANFYQRRNQILTNSVSKLSSLINAIHYDDQWIIPERSITWVELLRLDWATGGEKVEAARFYEEKSVAVIPQVQEDSLQAIPISFADPLGIPVERLSQMKYKLYVPPDNTITAYMPILGITMEEMGFTEDTRTFTYDSLQRFSQIKKKTIVLVKNDGTIMIGRHSLKPAEIYLLIDMGDSIGIIVYDVSQPMLKAVDLPLKVVNAIRDAPIVKGEEDIGTMAAPTKRRLIIRR